MIKGFGDAVVMQDASGLDRAVEDGKEAVESLRSIAAVKGLGGERSAEASKLASVLSQILTDARSLYGAVLGGGALTADRQEQLGAMAGRTEAAKAALAKAREGLAVDLHEQLSILEKRSARQSWLDLIVFVLALGGAGFISWVIVSSITGPLASALELVRGVAGGDLTRDMEVTSHDEIGQILAALNTMTASMRAALVEVRNSAEALTTASEEVANGCRMIAAGTHQSTASLEETSASLEEITATVHQNSDNAKQASELTAAACENATNGGAVVQSAVDAMAEINESSRKIEDILYSIDEIAFQTNLLAVNAAIEAARAGQEGRGFAVVAQEVRALAQRSAVAAKQIKTLITDSVSKVEKGSELVNHSGQTLQEIVGSVKRAAEMVGQISHASSEQATGIEQVNTSVTQMNRVTQSSSEQTDRLSHTAQHVSQKATELKKLLARFILSENPSSFEQPTAARG
jgi:methyl-accepting chemotaxis protein